MDRLTFEKIYTSFTPQYPRRSRPSKKSEYFLNNSTLTLRTSGIPALKEAEFFKFENQMNFHTGEALARVLKYIAGVIRVGDCCVEVKDEDSLASLP